MSETNSLKNSSTASLDFETPKLKNASPLAIGRLWKGNNLFVDAIASIIGLAIIAVVTTTTVNQINSSNSPFSNSVVNSLLITLPVVMGLIFLLTFINNHFSIGRL